MSDVARITTGRVIRGFVDGFVAVLLARYLTHLGFSPFQVGAVVTSTLVGSAVLTLLVGLRARRVALARLLIASCGLMTITGAAFASFEQFWPILVIAAVGTLNPSGGDVSVFLPIETALISELVEGTARVRTFARYNLGAVLAGAVGALVSGLPDRVARTHHWSVVDVEQAMFVVYACAGLVISTFYVGLVRHERGVRVESGPRAKLTGRVRRKVFGLAGLFSIDSAGSGFVGTAILVLWLHLRFDLGAATVALVFFGFGLAGAASMLLAPALSERIGLVRTMAYTHIPANLFLILAAFSPNGTWAVALLAGRALFSRMDVPARQAFVMALVPADQRTAASSVTNVPRSLAAAITPLAAGALLSHSHFGWPLLIAGAMKLVYDVALLVLHRETPEQHLSST